MGWYHVERKGRGMRIKKVPLDTLVENVPDEWLPTEEWVNKVYPESTGKMIPH